MEKMIVFHKGGTAQCSQPIDEVIIPDLWHVYQRLITAANVATTEWDRETLKSDAEAILRTWHQAHALKDHIAEEVARG